MCFKMDISTLGIVLRVIKYNDTSNIVDFYTQALGRCSVMVRIPKSKRSRNKTFLAQTFAVLDLDLRGKGQGGFYYLKEASVSYVYQSVPYNPIKSAIAFFLAEFVYFAVKEENENKSLFDYLLYSIEWLDLSEANYSNFHLVFLMRFSSFLGFYPNIDNYKEGDYFDLVHAEFTSSKPLTHSSCLNPNEASHIRQLMRMNYETMHLFKLSREERSRILLILNEFYRLHVPSFPRLNSLDILRELFD